MNNQDTVTSTTENSSSNGSLFSIDPGLMIWTWVVFVFLFIILKKFAWGPMMESISAREKLISETVENADKTRNELENISKRQEIMIKDAQEQVRNIIEKGRQTAEETANKITKKAELDAENSLLNARNQIAREKEQAISEIKEQVVDLVINTSEKLISEDLDDDMHRKIIEKHLEEK